MGWYKQHSSFAENPFDKQDRIGIMKIFRITILQ